jgi:acyl transferase domain-containing protein/thioesterase domain-containing protein
MESSEAVAIIGLACRFPGAPDIERFWSNLCNGVESIRTYGREELLRAGISPVLLDDPRYMRAGAHLDDVALFDADFFGVSPRDAALMDPQHRLFLECAYEALERAGHIDEGYGKIGVFGGSGANLYLLRNLFSAHRFAGDGRGGLEEEIPPGSDKDHLTTRVSYALGLTGPSITVQTACSTSLTAVAMACQNLFDYRCDTALAGGVSVESFGPEGYLHQPEGMLAPDGHCRAFDVRAAGTVFGSGAGVVVLRRLEDALASNDTILAVIRGFGIANDGSTRAGYVAPSVNGQAEAIEQALAMAGVEPDTVGYVETHGAGTPLGDPIEFAALVQAYGAGHNGEPCLIGSVKTNIGHLGPAAGVAGLIKTVLSLHRGMLPPMLHFDSPNPALEVEKTRFGFVTDLRPWPAREGMPRRAGVSSFGLGGTNVHLVLEEAPPHAPQGEVAGAQLVPVSAGSAAALEALMERLASHLEAAPDISLSALAATMSLGRKVMPFRSAIVARDIGEAARLLRRARARPTARATEGIGVAFLMPGLGEHYAGMGSGLYAREPRYRETVDACCARLLAVTGRDLRPFLTERTRVETGLDLRRLLGRGDAAVETGLDDAVSSHLATFIVEYALAATLSDWGVRPSALIGHSLGEYAAACLAGVMSLDDALVVVARRAALIDTMPRGAMLAVPLGEADARVLVRPGIDLAAVNAPDLCVLAGPEDTIAGVEAELGAAGTVARRLRTSHAFHSGMLQPVREALVNELRAISLSVPRIPMISNVTGDWLTPDEATDPNYWADHLCRTVRFSEGLNQLVAGRSLLLMEVGPGRTLTSLVEMHPGLAASSVATLSPPYHPRPDDEAVLDALGTAWVAGVPVDWRAVHAGRLSGRIPLPTYPYERRRHWIDPVAPPTVVQPTAAPRSIEQTVPFVPPQPPPAAHLRPAGADAYVAPSSKGERRIAEIWEGLFGFGPIGRDDDFFALGGHSLMALQFANRLWRDMRIQMSLRDLVQHPTPRLMSDLIESLSSRMEEEPSVPDLAAPGRTTRLEAYLANLIRRFGSLSAGVALEDLSTLPMEAIAPDLMAAIRRDFGIRVYPKELLDRRSLADLVAYLDAELPAAASRSPGPVPASWAASRVPGVCFLLSGVRAGSTLLRVMLAGHPKVFCPPEMHLLRHATLAERVAQDQSPDRDQGLIRAFAELLDADVGAARDHLNQLIEAGATVPELYDELRHRAGGRLVVDKSPGYALLPEALKRSELWFEQPKFVHLVRHPHAVIDSFVKNRFHRLMDAGEADPYLLAEFAWQTANTNIQDHLEGVDPARVHRMRYEDLVAAPREQMAGLCDFLGLGFDEAVLQPYEGRRMRDGLGDPNFLDHTGIDPSLGEAWRKVRLPRPLGRFSRRLAKEFGYEVVEKPACPAGPARASTGPGLPAGIELPDAPPKPQHETPRPALVHLRSGGARRPLFAVHPLDGSVFCYIGLARGLSGDRPLYGLQAPGLEEGALPPGTIEEMAALYVDEICRVQSAGPYLLCGWSLGGIIAFEMARQLIRAGQGVDFLCLMDSSVPGDLRPADDPRDDFNQHVARLAGGAGAGSGIDAVMERRFQVFRINGEAVRAYRPGEASTPILFLKAGTGEDRMRRKPPVEGWRGLSSGGVEEVRVSGDHYSMLRPPALEAMIGVIDGRLEGLG